MDRTSEAILRIQAAAGNQNERCTTCGRSPGAPYRRYDDRGKVTEGCIDAVHSGHLMGESSHWHNRPEAKRLRSRTLANLKGLKGGRRR